MHLIPLSRGGTERDSGRFAEIENLEARSLDIPDATCVVERARWIIDAFSGQLERPKMHGNAAGRIEIQVGLHRFCRIHVDGAHEPARLVGTYRQQCQVDRAQPSRNVPKEIGIRRVSGELQASLPCSHRKTTPERAIPVERRPRGKVMRRRRCDLV